MDLTIVVDFIVLWFVLICGYYVLLAGASFLPRRKVKHEVPRGPVKMLVLVPAKDEENVVTDLVRDLETQHYPRDMYRVLVIADHCTDGTSDAVRQASSGITRLIIRNDGEKGKGAALDYGVEHANDVFPGFDFRFIAVFDADNRVDSEVLTEIAKVLSSGQKAVQIKVLAKNPQTSLLARVQALESVVLQRVWQAGKDRLGLVNAFAGTGQAIDRDLLAQMGGFGNSLTDDLDLTIRLARNGVRVKYLHDVATYDEKPDSLKVEMRRRVRWSAGHLGSLMRHGPGILKSKPTLLRIDALFYLMAILTPLLLWLGYFVSFLDWIGLATFSPTPFIIWLFLSCFWPSLVLITPYLDGEKGLYRAAPALLLFLLSWMVAVPIALAKVAIGDDGWAKTPHGVKVDFRFANPRTGKESISH